MLKLKNLDNLVTSALSLIIFAVVYQIYLKYALSENLFFDELFTLGANKKPLLQLWREYITIKETHPAIYDFIIGIFYNEFQSTKLLRLTSLIPNLLSFGLFFYILAKKKALKSTSAYFLLILLCNSELMWWLFQIRSYSWQVFLFLCIVVTRDAHFKKEQAKVALYSLLIILFGSLHFSSLLLAFFLTILEKKEHIPRKVKAFIIIFLTPALYALGNNMISQDFSPNRILHYPVTNFDFFKSFFLMLSDGIRLPLIILPFVLYQYRHKIYIKKFFYDYLSLNLTILIFFTVAFISYLFKMRWLNTHTILYLIPAFYALVFLALQKLNPKLQIIFVILSIFLNYAKFNKAIQEKDICQSCFSNTFLSVIKDPEFKDYTIISCLNGKAQQSADILTEIYKLNYDAEKFTQICTQDEFEDKFRSDNFAQKKIIFIHEGGHHLTDLPKLFPLRKRGFYHN